jgi:hypothetical protein
VKVLGDRWTAVTVDGQLSAHFEHTIAITDGAPEVLTEWDSPCFEKVFALVGSENRSAHTGTAHG